MKKLWTKRVLPVFLLAALILSLLVGCASETGGSSTPQTPENSAEEPVKETESEGETEDVNENENENESEGADAVELPYHKIGFICWSYTGNLEMAYKTTMEKLGAALNFDVEFVEASGNEDVLAAIENLAESGCEAIISTTAPPTVMELCTEKGIYFAQYSNNVDDETRAEFEKSEYWLGYIANNDYEAGYNGITTLYDQGCREIGLLTVPPGMQDNHDKRYAGMVAACEDLGITYYEYRGTSFMDAIENFCTLYPNMDGMFSTFASSGALDGFMQTLDTIGKADQIRMGAIDIADTTGIYIDEGRFGFAAGGQFPDCELCVALVLNALNGERLGGGPVYATSAFIEIASAEDMDNYDTYVCGEIPPYTPEEIMQLLTVVNPDASPEDIQRYAENYSIADVMERHQDLY